MDLCFLAILVGTVIHRSQQTGFVINERQTLSAAVSSGEGVAVFFAFVLTVTKSF
jgi:hypothetical protein